MTVPPKRRTSSSRGRRRSHHKVATAALHKCPNCGQAKMPHRVCQHCGFYKNQEVIKKKPSSTKKK
ncbi:MAG: 50S ribosomal protein L32 [Candidatus Komeilibacteria bacterium]|nr:50S ribosomal protein L32 [Candidatus Komeilibacteria bacterium]